MYANEVFEAVVERAFSSRTNAEEIANALGLDANMLRANNPIDDGVPPNGITGLVVVPIMGGLKFRWDAPPPEDAVASSKVELTPDGGSTFEEDFASVVEGTVYGLDAVPHTVRVALRDQFGRESAWSESQIATPNTIASTDIDLAYMQAQGNLQGLIEAINLAGPSAEEGIRATSMAATLENNMLPVVESDLEMWDGSVWPPPDAKLADGTPVISSEVDTGHTVSLVVHQGQKKIKHDRATPSTNYFVPVTQWREERRSVTGQMYIAQATVFGQSGTQVMIEVQNAEDLSGTNASIANTKTVTLPAGTSKVFVAFAGDSAKPYFRIRLGLVTDNQTVYWNRFMVERARAGATEPSPWNSGIIATGTISARALTAMTANVADAVIENAAIRDAKIESLKVDKLTAGNLDVSVNLTVGGKIQAGGMVMDDRGGWLVQQGIDPDGPDAWPSASTNDWLSSPPGVGVTPTPHSGIGFFDDTNDPRRGILIHTRGVPNAGKAGYISIAATPGGTSRTANGAAFITIRAGQGVNPDTGTVVIGNKLVVSGLISLPNNAIGSDEIAGLNASKVNGRLHKDNIPPIQDLNGSLSWGAIKNTPDLTKYLTEGDLRAYTTVSKVRSIVKDMVKKSALA